MQMQNEGTVRPAVRNMYQKCITFDWEAMIRGLASRGSSMDNIGMCIEDGSRALTALVLMREYQTPTNNVIWLFTNARAAHEEAGGG